jgi:O-antigen/teichoic acid export membrane protein
MSEDRSLKVARNARAWMIKNVAGVVVSFATVPLALRALGVEGYGAFQVLMSIANLVAMSDLGLGTALFTRVGRLAGSKRHDEIGQLAGGALMVISAVVLLMGSLSVGTLFVMDVPGFLKTPSRFWGQAQNGLYLILAAFVVRMPLSVFTSVHGGLQLGNRLLGWNMAGAFGSSVAVIVAATLTHRIDVSIGAQLAVSLMFTIGAVRLGFRLEPASKPVFRRRDIASGWELMRTGFFYYLFQVETTVIASLDNIVIAKVVGVEAVALYSVASRIISMAYLMVYAFGGSFWPGVANAMGHGDVSWIRTEAAKLRRLGTLGMAILAGGFTAVGVPVIALWTGNRLQVSPLLLVTLGTYYVLVAHTMIDGSMLSGAEKIRPQIVILGLEAAVNLLLSIGLGYRIGYVGVGLGTLLAHALCSFVPLQYFSWRSVVQGPRPPFWTRALSAATLSVAGGAAVYWAFSHVPLTGRLGEIAVGGCSSVVITLVFVRLIVGREGIDAIRNAFRRVAPPPIVGA